MVVKVEYDTGKDAINIAKHNIALRFSIQLFEGKYKEKPDDRRDYGETRMIATGPVGGRLYVCIYTWRNDIRRIISLRKANKGEINDYYKSEF